MVVIKGLNSIEPSHDDTLQALTAAALSLPGLSIRSLSDKSKNESRVEAETTPLRILATTGLTLSGLIGFPVQGANFVDDFMDLNNFHPEGGNFSIQYNHFGEGNNTPSQFRMKKNTIHVDSIHGSAEVNLSDRLTFVAQFIQDTWSGATEITSAPAAVTRWNPNAESGASGFLNIQQGLVNFDTQTGQGLATIPNTFDQLMTGEVINVMAEASPETRKQGDFTLSYRWNDDITFNLGGGDSDERDFHSQYFRFGEIWDFNQKHTTFNWNVSYTHNSITADRFPFRLGSAPVNAQTPTNPDFPDWSVYVNEDRHDISLNLGVSQVLDKNSYFDADFIYLRNAGYNSDPYKEALFLIPLTTPGTAWTYSRYDNRPDLRDQFTWKFGYTHFFEKPKAALKLNYSFFHDTWDINASTFGASWAQPVGYGWTLTPNVRYYSQSAASFYSPYFIGSQTPISLTDALNNQATLPTPQYFSSDYRLSGYGVISGGLSVSKQFTEGVTLAGSFNYYRLQGDLKLGSGGVGNFADISYYATNASINMDLGALARPGGILSAHHSSNHSGHGGHNIPAGVMYAHMLDEPGQLMVGLRYTHEGWKPPSGGAMLHGTQPASLTDIMNNGCGSNGATCGMAPMHMDMSMEMIEFMYAPTSWATLMFMPSFMDMQMPMENIPGAPQVTPGQSSMIMPSGVLREATGGIGDTQFLALWRLYDSPHQMVPRAQHHIHLTTGLSAPTGHSGLTLNDQETDTTSPFFGQALFYEYDMQLGSGTWDFLPSLTYTGNIDRWSWGSQFNGIVRTGRNSSGYGLGDRFEAMTWGSYDIFNWLSFSTRGMYTMQGAINGQFNEKVQTVGAMPDRYPTNYGGQYWDVGFGLNAAIQEGTLKGNHLSLEWLQPVYQNVNGYQLSKVGSIFATWGFDF
ncbi:DUF3570 domain-containing protein [Candidatus Nitrosacidococcus tergens]|uniref:DUF3570 domain-containing protein n=1 Tax=Candidatus Nitrosacidococcus tergens TaxID=553981 RepID=A0A7G1Q8J2_9GAMM|nr:DUF3570 domain-containing protein [Candidatus Nitrosacidococcus tergens]CAB1275108.1 conserved protein of unknown function [Candidatus Nitrosacidococcus tergens]